MIRLSISQNLSLILSTNYNECVFGISIRHTHPKTKIGNMVWGGKTSTLSVSVLFWAIDIRWKKSD